MEDRHRTDDLTPDMSEKDSSSKLSPLNQPLSLSDYEKVNYFWLKISLGILKYKQVIFWFLSIKLTIKIWRSDKMYNDFVSF